MQVTQGIAMHFFIAHTKSVLAIQMSLFQDLPQKICSTTKLVAILEVKLVIHVSDKILKKIDKKILKFVF